MCVVLFLKKSGANAFFPIVVDFWGKRYVIGEKQSIYVAAVCRYVNLFFPLNELI